MPGITPVRHERRRASRRAPSLRLRLVGLVAGAIVALTLATVPEARASAADPGSQHGHHPALSGNGRG